MRSHGANVNVYCETYKARSKRLYSVIPIVIYSGKKQNYSESTKMSGYKERMRRSTEDFWGNEPILYI